METINETPPLNKVEYTPHWSQPKQARLAGVLLEARRLEAEKAEAYRFHRQKLVETLPDFTEEQIDDLIAKAPVLVNILSELEIA